MNGKLSRAWNKIAYFLLADVCGANLRIQPFSGTVAESTAACDPPCQHAHVELITDLHAINVSLNHCIIGKGM